MRLIKGLLGLMLAMPLIGWAMLSAGGYPIVLWGGLHLPPIVPHTPALYAALRNAHSLLAYVLFATVLMHVGAALFHLWVRRDGVFQAMARGSSSRGTSMGAMALLAGDRKAREAPNSTEAAKIGHRPVWPLNASQARTPAVQLSTRIEITTVRRRS